MKFISIFLVSALAIIAGCGQTAEEKEIAKKQAQLTAIQIENTEKQAVIEALKLLVGLKETIAEELTTKNTCTYRTIDRVC